MESFLLFLLFIVVLMLLLGTGMPVAVAMGVTGIMGALLFVSPRALSQFASIAFSQSTSFVLIVTPLFILMSEALSASPVGENLFRMGRLWLGRLPGSLAMGTVLASTVFAAATGSSVVTAATVGRMAVTEMQRQGYDRRLALGSVSSGGTLGILIPPSIPMIIYAIITETSIGALFMAGILPGLLIAGLLCLTILAIVLKYPHLAPPVQIQVAWKERFQALLAILPVAILAILVLGSIYRGIATPSESAAIGALAALLIAGIGGHLRGKLGMVLENTVRTTAMFMFLLICGLFSSFILNRLGIPQGMAAVLTGLSAPPWVIIVLINLLLIVLGMFLDPLSILVVMVPVLFPAVTALGYDPVWFGVMLTINAEIGAITPPVGLNLFVMKSVVPGVNMSDVITGSLWFVFPLLLGLALVIFFPQIALYMPTLMR